MKTATLTYPTQNFIDLALMRFEQNARAARYEVLTRAVLTYLAAGQMRAMLRCSQKVLRLVRVYARLDAENTLWARKLEMLSNKNWRERVLRDLGGMRKLTLWEAARDRVLARGGNPVGPSHPPTVAEPSWLRTPERIAESERLKAHARHCMRAGVSQQTHVVRDRVKTDFDGLFRLPPMPRMRAVTREPKVYTQRSIVEYRFNAVPFGEVVGFGPAIVWPVEFYAAAALDSSTSVIPHKGEARRWGIKRQGAVLRNLIPHQRRKRLVRDDRGEVATIPLHHTITLSTHRYLFENPV